ncbi:hypothetical protein LGM43_13880 [Burkholderia seminalis]|uniref:hypothetical protein n=1 Tax=Burkholderia seminalis TaxID=488731 RepID=UPI001CF22B1A|nr:hypothetical protein [Burkholderia seminalis]MCA7951358.1 hypothetical protein [Burkholderia seminalis]
MKGYVDVMSNKAMPGLIKVGYFDFGDDRKESRDHRDYRERRSRRSWRSRSARRQQRPRWNAKPISRKSMNGSNTPI